MLMKCAMLNMSTPYGNMCRRYWKNESNPGNAPRYGGSMAFTVLIFTPAHRERKSGNTPKATCELGLHRSSDSTLTTGSHCIRPKRWVVRPTRFLLETSASCKQVKESSKMSADWSSPNPASSFLIPNSRNSWAAAPAVQVRAVDGCGLQNEQRSSHFRLPLAWQKGCLLFSTSTFLIRIKGKIRNKTYSI